MDTLTESSYNFWPPNTSFQTWGRWKRCFRWENWVPDGKRFSPSPMAGWDSGPAQAPNVHSPGTLCADWRSPEAGQCRRWAATIHPAGSRLVSWSPTKEGLREGASWKLAPCESARLSLPILKDKSRCFLGNGPNAHPSAMGWHCSRTVSEGENQAQCH